MANAPQIGDKVWFRDGGINWRADIAHVWDDGTCDLNVHGSVHEVLKRDQTRTVSDQPDPDRHGNLMLLRGAHAVSMAVDEADRVNDGRWWHRIGKLGPNAHGRREWFGE